MKNKKIILLTTAFIAFVRLGIYSFSLAFETTWQGENETDNTLIVNTDIIDDEYTVFNYPYLQYSNHKDELSEYSAWFGENWSQWRTEEFIQLEEGMISYQEAANIAGEAIKYVYGISEHSQTAGVIQLYNFTPSRNYIEGKRYIYRFFDNENYLYTVNIDPFKKLIFALSRDDLKGYITPPAADITDEEIQQLKAIFTQYLDLFNIDSEILSFHAVASMAQDGYRHYTINSYLSNDHMASVSINKAPGEYYQLATFILLYSSHKAE